MISERIDRIKQTLPEGVRLVAVSKYHPASMIQEAYDGGQRIFGESHVQELVQKYDILPKDIQWHFIGHLQTNKVKYIAPFVSLIHAVDSEHLLREIDKQAKKCGRIIPVLMQVHVAKEETKFGFAPEDLDAHNLSQLVLPHVRVRGLMGMASNTDDKERVRADFRAVRSFFRELKQLAFSDKPYFDTISMGMSHDYLLAIEEGSTMVRIGSSIFGARDYSKIKK